MRSWTFYSHATAESHALGDTVAAMLQEVPALVRKHINNLGLCHQVPAIVQLRHVLARCPCFDSRAVQRCKTSFEAMERCCCEALLGRSTPRMAISLICSGRPRILNAGCLETGKHRFFNCQPVGNQRPYPCKVFKYGYFSSFHLIPRLDTVNI